MDGMRSVRCWEGWSQDTRMLFMGANIAERYRKRAEKILYTNTLCLDINYIIRLPHSPFSSKPKRWIYYYCYDFVLFNQHPQHSWYIWPTSSMWIHCVIVFLHLFPSHIDTRSRRIVWMVDALHTVAFWLLIRSFRKYAPIRSGLTTSLSTCNGCAAVLSFSLSLLVLHQTDIAPLWLGGGGWCSRIIMTQKWTRRTHDIRTRMRKSIKKMFKQQKLITIFHTLAHTFRLCVAISLYLTYIRSVYIFMPSQTISVGRLCIYRTSLLWFFFFFLLRVC